MKVGTLGFNAGLTYDFTPVTYPESVSLSLQIGDNETPP